MAAWQAGIVVVVAAGQRGPEPDDHRRARQRALRHHDRRAHRQLHALQSDATIGSPRSPRRARPTRASSSPRWSRPAATWSPRCRAAATSRTSIRTRWRPTEQMFTMSGTSMAAAVTTGVVALMLQSDPALTPDQVKCRLLASARPAVTSERHARLQRLPAGRRPHQRRLRGQQLGDRLRQSSGSTSPPISPAPSTSAARPTRTPTATTTS